jgi:hypothetical protein
MKVPKFYSCGICGSYHSIDWDGDCREDQARFDPEQLDAAHGVTGWEEVDMPGSEDDSPEGIYGDALRNNPDA